MKSSLDSPVVVLISADAEWAAVQEYFPHQEVYQSPFGEFFEKSVACSGALTPIVFVQGGWGKIAAAASTQYAIQRWQPHLLINLGTCGGFRGLAQPGEIILVERTLVYDIDEQMGDSAAHIAHYSTQLDLSWLGDHLPMPVRRTLLVSADRDLLPADLPELHQRYGAIAGDWESGAIAWVAQRNQTHCLILRGVSDVVDESGGEAYGDLAMFQQAARRIMHCLLESLPGWLEAAGM
jgi:adenosylhomocysteine nucleosidase